MSKICRKFGAIKYIYGENEYFVKWDFHEWCFNTVNEKYQMISYLTQKMLMMELAMERDEKMDASSLSNTAVVVLALS